MDTVLDYDDLDTKNIDPIFSQIGQLFVSLPPLRAAPLISFIEIVRESKDWRPNRTPFIYRLPTLAKSILLLFRIMVRHSRLLELAQVIILNSSSQTWEQLSNGQVLFRFTR